MRGIRGSRVQLAIVAGCIALTGDLSASHAAPRVGLPEVRLSARNTVPACVTPQRLTRFLRARNPELEPRFLRIAEHYERYGAKLGVRWDIGFFQMLVETANLTFRRPDGRPGDVAAEHNNFAGIGAVGDGRPGETFGSIAHGVRAHLEHVLHYAGVAVPAPVAERTRKVQAWKVLADWHRQFDRPITFGELARRWAPHSDAYRASIALLAQTFQDRYCSGEPVLMVRHDRRPAIAETAWHFARSSGRPGAAGTVPPTGRPNLKSHRKSLGASAVRRGSIAAIAPPPTKRQPRRVQRIAAVARPQPVVKAAATSPSRRRTASVRRPRISANDRVRQLISDRKVLLRTSVGAVVPIVYNGNGRMRGEAGALSFFLGASVDKGRWWVEKGKLCQKWRVWLDRETHCMRLKVRQGTIWWRADDGKSGTARIVAK
ncbi:MAG: glucosaminidase domain-containing protein [Hyphomicrobiaceae bacterium]